MTGRHLRSSRTPMGAIRLSSSLHKARKDRWLAVPLPFPAERVLSGALQRGGRCLVKGSATPAAFTTTLTAAVIGVRTGVLG
jgi:hypothetical protein